MEVYDAITAAAAARGISTRQMLLRAGKPESTIAKARNRGSVPTTTTAAQLLAACDYVLCAVPSESVPSDALVIDE